MHKYLRSIGFSKIKSRHDLESIYHDVLSKPDKKCATTIASDTTLVQLDKDFGKDIGLSLIGEISSNGNISIEHYFPYVKPHLLHETEYIRIENDPEKEAYRGVLDVYTMSVIFYILNICDYAKLAWFNRKKNITSIMLSALAANGTILLPVEKTVEEVKIEQSRVKHNYSLLSQAKMGDIEAFEKLAISDFDLKNQISQRLSKSEDIFSIVDTSMIPYEVSSDHYDIVGNITHYSYTYNAVTGEKLCLMDIDCYGFSINVCINTLDLLGEPEVGRRFKGSVWLQGFLNY